LSKTINAIINEFADKNHVPEGFVSEK